MRMLVAGVLLAAGGAQAAEPPAPEAVIGALLAEAGLAMAGLAMCEAGYLGAPAATLGADVAGHLAMLGEGGGVVSAVCEPEQQGGRTCRVGLGRAAGDDVWTRFYRFTLTAEGRMAPETLFCTTVP